MCCLVGGRVRLGVSPEWSWGQVRWGIAVGGRVRHAQCTVGMRVRSIGSVTHSCSDYHLCSRSPRIVAKCL